jgi:para-aminobenzoate synthetase component 1
MRSRAVSETWRVESRDLSASDFFADLPRHPFAFLYGEGRWLILAEDPMVILDSPCPENLAFQRHGTLPPILPDLVGHIAYEYGYGLDPALPAPPRHEDALPDFHLALHRKVRLFDRQEGLLYTGEREGNWEIPPRLHSLGAGRFAARFREGTENPESYKAKVTRIREEIARGNVYQVNLTRQERWAYEGDLAEFAKRLHAVNPAPYSALIADAEWAIVSSSPESFFRMEEGGLTTRPIKGTAPRGITPEDDARLGASLLASLKNRSELAMIVDLLRNDFARICRLSSVRVADFPVLETYANVHHLVATILGELETGMTMEALLRAVFPGGSITGCPKLAAMALIRELEPWPRRVYTGALGWCRADLTQGEFAIPIRTAWASRGQLRFGVGGGVVWDSDPREEYEETVHKGRSLVQCLSS